jgi:hypothetical protein
MCKKASIESLAASCSGDLHKGSGHPRLGHLPLSRNTSRLTIQKRNSNRLGVNHDGPSPSGIGSLDMLNAAGASAAGELDRLERCCRGMALTVSPLSLLSMHRGVTKHVACGPLQKTQLLHAQCFVRNWKLFLQHHHTSPWYLEVLCTRSVLRDALLRPAAVVKRLITLNSL